MTEAEAILWVDDRMCYGRYTPQKHSPFIHDECCQAGEMAITALEKQIPYKPQEYEDKYYGCKCGEVLLEKWEEYPTKLMDKRWGLPYCLGCGQKLDWSEV